MLEIKHIRKFYNQGTVNEMCLFEDFSLTVRQGEFVSVVGSNGSGKTSLLNIICGSIPVDAGSIPSTEPTFQKCRNTNGRGSSAGSFRTLLWEPALT